MLFVPFLKRLGYRPTGWRDGGYTGRMLAFAAQFAPLLLSLTYCGESSDLTKRRCQKVLFWFESAPLAAFRGGAVKPGRLPEDEVNKVIALMRASGYNVDIVE